ncbi:hypothetical protein [Haloferax sulfurifontis]|uniref:Uncharacterized protein n=1 Tax=Haloferax sulfurifontis ATCC BAA-897 TaxID=662480 RepID=M0IU56_9EURY|nr:hypothetical protein [Haloferax sulfurifontis]ELZ99358.1 hypothetical protein C441_00510 [Haloferax sulfurifontis ATCC BAA-897]
MTKTATRDGPTRRRFLRTTGLLAGGLALGVGATGTAVAGVSVANGWYEEEEIYYVAHGVEEGVTERGENDIYLIGGDRTLQAQVVEFVPGESGYSPHWNVNLVNTAAGKTVADIVASPHVSDHYPEALFDDVEDVRAAADAGLVTISKPGVVVLCPIVPERVADAPGNTELPEAFPRPWPTTF